MTEYRIVELHRRFHIEKLAKGNSWDSWIALNEPHVPRYFDSLADARSWVATIKKGVVYHDAEDAPNLAQDERKAEDDTSDGIKSLEWFCRMRGLTLGCFSSDSFSLESPYDFKKARELYKSQFDKGCRYVYKSVFD